MKSSCTSRAGLALLLAVSVVAVCGEAGPSDGVSTTAGDQGSVTEPPTTRPDLTVPPGDTRGTVQPPTVPPGADTASSPQVVAAVEDLAERLGVDEALIGIVGWEDVTWSDGSIGCPEPGFSYTQALVDGMRVVLAHDGVRYSYHAAGGEEPFLCEEPTEPRS